MVLNASGSTLGAAGYLCEADLNRDGVINSTVNTYYLNDLGPALPAGQLSALDSPVGFAGYLFNDDNALYTVRHRTYSTDQGRWVERDPAGYVDGSGLYEYARSAPISLNDPSGLACTIRMTCRLIDETPINLFSKTCHYMCQENTIPGHGLDRTDSAGGCVSCSDVPDEPYTRTRETTAILASCRDSFDDTAVIMDPAADRPDCSAAACRAGCDVLFAVADDACDIIVSDIAKALCKGAAAAGQLACHGGCNTWCTRP